MRSLLPFFVVYFASATSTATKSLPAIFKKADKDPLLLDKLGPFTGKEFLHGVAVWASLSWNINALDQLSSNSIGLLGDFWLAQAVEQGNKAAFDFLLPKVTAAQMTPALRLAIRMAKDDLTIAMLVTSEYACAGDEELLLAVKEQKFLLVKSMLTYGLKHFTSLGLDAGLIEASARNDEQIFTEVLGKADPFAGNGRVLLDTAMRGVRSRLLMLLEAIKVNRPHSLQYVGQIFLDAVFNHYAKTNRLKAVISALDIINKSLHVKEQFKISSYCLTKAMENNAYWHLFDPENYHDRFRIVKGILRYSGPWTGFYEALARYSQVHMPGYEYALWGLANAKELQVYANIDLQFSSAKISDHLVILDKGVGVDELDALALKYTLGTACRMMVASGQENALLGLKIFKNPECHVAALEEAIIEEKTEFYKAALETIRYSAKLYKQLISTALNVNNKEFIELAKLRSRIYTGLWDRQALLHFIRIDDQVMVEFIHKYIEQPYQYDFITGDLVLAASMRKNGPMVRFLIDHSTVDGCMLNGKLIYDALVYDDKDLAKHLLTKCKNRFSIPAELEVRADIAEGEEKWEIRRYARRVWHDLRHDPTMDSVLMALHPIANGDLKSHTLELLMRQDFKGLESSLNKCLNDILIGNYGPVKIREAEEKLEIILSRPEIRELLAWHRLPLDGHTKLHDVLRKWHDVYQKEAKSRGFPMATLWSNRHFDFSSMALNKEKCRLATVDSSYDRHGHWIATDGSLPTFPSLSELDGRQKFLSILVAILLKMSYNHSGIQIMSIIPTFVQAPLSIVSYGLMFFISFLIISFVWQNSRA